MSTHLPAASGPEPSPENLSGGPGPERAKAVSADTNPYPKLLLWLGAALLLRLFILRFPYMFTLDVNTFRSWTDTIVKVGPAQFYANTWSDYPPVFMYFLWIWGWIQQVFTHTSMPSATWMKLPAILADMANAFLIFQLLKGRVAIRSATRTAIFYAFNPVVIFVSAVWGQVDAIITLMMLLVSLLVLSNRIVAAAAMSALAVLVKPQGLFIIPLVFLSSWFKTPLKKWPLAILAGFATVWVCVLPAVWGKLGGMSSGMFGLPVPTFLAQPFFFLTKQMQATGDNYPHSTVNAFNIWLLPPPNESWKPDSRVLFFLTHQQWGVLLIVALLAFVGWYLYRNRHVVSAFPYFLAGSVTLTAFYMLPTRMHERYIFPALAFLALAQAFNRRLTWIYAGFSLTSLLSIAYVFFFYNDQSAWVEGVKTIMGNGPMLGNLKLSGQVVLALANIWLFGELISFLFVKADVVQEFSENRLVKQFRLLSATVRTQVVGAVDWAIASTFALVFLVFGSIRLGTPNEQIFDEVYHARTAMEYIAGVNPYEWTHPPLAKLIASLGILAFHQPFDLASKTWTEAQAFAWRFPSVVFGALTLMVAYALTRSFFQNRAIATAATALLFLDGVFFVQSRVAMTNIYEVCFLLVGVYGLWKYISTARDRYLLVMGFGLGCALATRWSSLYAWGLTGLALLLYAWFARRAEWGMVPAASATDWAARLKSALVATNWKAVFGWVVRVGAAMVGIPLLVYFVSYVPYVLQGDGSWQLKLFSWDWNTHGWGKVIAMQRDMWNYHAGLTATHPYSSPWWSWPLMLRPTWYYFHDWKNGSLSGVWAIGNAFIWWASVPALLYAGYLAWRDKLVHLALITGMGLALWMMWGVQPRSLLYMHYMFETIPFACMALAYIGYLLWNGESREPAPEPGAGGEAVAVSAPLWTRAQQRYVVIAFGALAVAWFVFYYPLLAAVPIPWGYYNMHLWFGRAWI